MDSRSPFIAYPYQDAQYHERRTGEEVGMAGLAPDSSRMAGSRSPSPLASRSGAMFIVSHTPIASPLAPSTASFSPTEYSPSIITSSDGTSIGGGLGIDEGKKEEALELLNSVGRLPVLSEDDPHGIDNSWEDWLAKYSGGEWIGGEGKMEMPAALRAHLENNKQTQIPPLSPPIESPPAVAPSSQLHIYPASINSSTETRNPTALMEFFKDNGYFPAVRGPHEEERLRTIKKYGLDNDGRREAVDRVCRIAKKYFQTSTVLITLVLEDHQLLSSSIGWASNGNNIEPPTTVPLDPSLCTHAMLNMDKTSVFKIDDVEQDWRFKNSPYALKNGGKLGFYTSANIHLPSASSTTKRAVPPQSDSEPIIEEPSEKPESMPVGSLCIIDNRPKAAGAFSEDDRGVLVDLADMVSREFQLGFEQSRRTTEAQQTSFLNDFMNSLLVSPTATTHSPQISSAAAHFQQPSSSHSNSAPATNAIKNLPIAGEGESFMELHQNAACRLRELTKAGGTAILDLRGFKFSAPGSGGTGSNFTFGSSASGEQRERRESSGGNSAFERFSRNGKGKLTLMGASGNGTVVEEEGVEGSEDGKTFWEGLLRDEAQRMGDAVKAVVAHYYATGTMNFNLSAENLELNPLRVLLPATATCLVPIFDVDGKPSLLIVLTSTERHFQFEDADVSFVKHVGAVIMGAFLRQRAVEADRAKLAFVSQISHELRTPLHGVNSQVELIRELSSPDQLVVIKPLLDMADVCLETLRDVLDDTLDFAKLTNSSKEEIVVAHNRSLGIANLESLLEAVAKTTWARKRRVDLVSAEEQCRDENLGQRSEFVEEKVDLILDVQERIEGWEAWIDVGGMKRVLLNLLSNALKFTSSGHVKLSLSEIMDQNSVLDGKRTVAIDVEDTGCGMSAEFITNGKLFTPFIQENPFVNGAGLGMSICDTIIKRMGGKILVASALGQGTTIRFTIPLDFSNISFSDQLTTHSPTSAPSSLHSRMTLTTTGLNLSPQAIKSPSRSRIISAELCSLSTPSFNSLGIPRPGRERSPSLSISTADSDFKVGNRRVLETRSSDESVDSLEKQKDLPRSPVEIGGVAKRDRVRVLCADDNVLARKILAKFLTQKGVSFSSACDGQEAVELYKAGNYNLLLLDVQMPVKDGIEAAFEIREYEKAKDLDRCRIIALTGLSNEADMEKAGVLHLDGPIDSWITKGGKSLKSILEEIDVMQAQEVAREMLK